MVKSVIFLFLIPSLFTISVLRAQPLSAVSIFEKRFANVNNYPLNTLAFSDFKNKKLIILDFWNHGCIPCWQGFSELSELQKRFNDQIQIIAINRESLDSTLRFVQKRKKLHLPDVPQVMNGSFLDSFFNQRNNPAAIWMDGQGNVLYRTPGVYINDTIIKEYLSENITTPIAGFKKWMDLPSLIDSNYLSAVPYFSYIGRCIDYGRVRLSDDEEEVSISTSQCLNFLQLYQIAFNEDARNFQKGYARIGRTFLKGKAASIPLAPVSVSDYVNWVNNYSYYYQLKLPIELKSTRFEVMRQDLARYFSLNAHVETRPILTCVLKRVGNKKILKSKGEDKISNYGFNSFFEPNPDSMATFYNAPFEDVSDRLRYSVEERLKLPFEDETGINGNVDFFMKMDVLDNPTLTKLNAQLKGYDLVITKEKRNLAVLIISGKD